MRVHDVTDRLVGDQLLRFRDVGESTRLGLSGLEHHDVVLELDNQRIVTAGSGGEPVDTVAELFGSDGQSRCSAAATASRCWSGARSWRNAAPPERRDRRQRQVPQPARLRQPAHRHLQVEPPAGAPPAAATASRCRLRRERRDIRRIRLRRRHIDFKEGPSAARLHDLRRSHDSAEILPAGVDGEDVHVAHDVVAQPCLDTLDDSSVHSRSR